MRTSIRFGNAEIRPASRQVLVDGQPAPLGARAFEVLLALIARRDRLVGKAELLDLVWPGLVVEENNLQVQISSLRKLLGPQVIGTIPGLGYRFTADLDDESSVDLQSVPVTGDGAALATVGPRRAMENRCADLNNLVAACRRNIAAGNAHAAAGALDGAWAALSRHGPFKAGIDLAAAVCAMPKLQGAAAARAQAAFGVGRASCSETWSRSTPILAAWTRHEQVARSRS